MQTVIQFIFILILLGFSSLTASYAQDAAPLSAKDRKQISEQVWETVNDKYYDPKLNGIDWKDVRKKYKDQLENAPNDAEFYRLLNLMVSELHDAHTRIRDPYKRILFDRMEAVSAGISIGEVEGQNVILNVLPGSDAEKAKIKPGMIVRAIDKKPIEERLKEIAQSMITSSSERATKTMVYNALLDGVEGAKVTLWLENPDDATKFLEVELTRKIYSTAVQVTSTKLSSGYGYIRLNRWKDPAHEQFRQALLGLRETPGLVIDLREKSACPLKVASRHSNLARKLPPLKSAFPSNFAPQRSRGPWKIAPCEVNVVPKYPASKTSRGRKRHARTIGPAKDWRVRPSQLAQRRTREGDARFASRRE